MGEYRYIEKKLDEWIGGRIDIMVLRVMEWLFRIRRRLASGSGSDQGNPRSILLVELTHLGDALTALPAVGAISGAYPDAAITWIVRESFADFLRLQVPQVSILGVHAESGFSMLLQALRQAIGGRWDLACSLGPGRLNGAVAILSGAKAVAGFLECSGSKTPFRRTNIVSALGIGKRSRVLQSHEPLALRPLKICEALGISSPPSDLLPHKTDTVTIRSNTVVLQPFAGWKYRMWPMERWAELAKRLTEVSSRNVVILGQTNDSEALEILRAMVSGVPGLKIVEARTLLEAARVVAGCDLFVGCDSGPLHLATYLGVRSIGLFGPAEPALTRPVWSPPSLFQGIYHRLECSPCDQLRCIRPDSSCMTLIPVDQVIEAAGKMLGSVHENAVRKYE